MKSKLLILLSITALITWGFTRTVSIHKQAPAYKAPSVSHTSPIKVSQPVVTSTAAQEPQSEEQAPVVINTPQAVPQQPQKVQVSPQAASTVAPEQKPQAQVNPNQGSCPSATSQGAYFQRGIDPATGQPICGFAYYNECPYTEAVSADDPMCNKVGGK